MSKKTKQISEPFTAIIAGKAGCGKTTACINRIEKCVADNKRLKHDYRIIVVTDLTDEYKEFKPITDIKKLSTFKNKVMVLPSSKIEDIYSAKNCLIVFDGIPLSNQNTNLVITTRSHDRSFFITTQSLQRIPHRIWQNANYLQLFETLDKDFLHGEFYDILRLAKVAVSVRGRGYYSVIINLAEQKIKTDPYCAFHAARMLADDDVGEYNVHNLKELGKRILKYANYFHD